MKKALTLVLILTICISTFVLSHMSKAYAQGDTKIVLTTDKEEYKTGDTFKVYIKGENVVDMFGLQFTLNYDPAMIEMQGEDIALESSYKVFGGKTVDKQKGILTYPLINPDSTKNKKKTEIVGCVTFKALRDGPVILTLEDIKAVNTDIKEIQYNT